jgi:hypothetical protein
MKKNFKTQRLNMPGDKPVKENEIVDDYDILSIKKSEYDKSPVKPGTGSPSHVRSAMGSKEGNSPKGR